MKIIKSGFKSLINKFGYVVLKKRGDYEVIDKSTLAQYLKKDDYLQAYFDAIEKAGLKAFDSFLNQRRLYQVYQMAKYIIKNNISGDFSECGCWKGHSTYMVSKLLQDNEFNQTFHVFDSFEGGLSNKNKEDENLRVELTKEQIKKEKMIFSNSEGEVRDLLSDFKFVKLYPGWIPDRFGEVNDCNFAFVFIDLDLYQPTLDSLEFFYPRLVSGGVIVIDDYESTQFPGVKTAVNNLLNKNEPTFTFTDSMGNFIIIK